MLRSTYPIDEYGRECSKCNVYKTWNKFSKSKKSGTLHIASCKDCIKLYEEATKEDRQETSRKYREDNRDALLQKKRDYHHANKERLNAISRKYHQDNHETQLEYGAKYREENRVELRAKKKIHRDNNKALISAQKKASRKRNHKSIKEKRSSQEYKAKRNKSRRERYKSDENYKIECVLRSRLVSAVNAQATSKRESTLNLLGCDIDYFKNYIEAQWEEGMTWENHALEGWHMDHIIPCDAFDLTDLEQQKKCFHYTNIQPLWAEENILKGTKII